MTSTILVSATNVLQPGNVQLVRRRFKIVERHRHPLSALPARRLRIVAALAVMVARERMPLRILVDVHGSGELEQNGEASVSDAFLHTPISVALAMTLLAAFTPKRGVRKS